MHKKFEINRTEIKGGCQSGRKVVTHNFKSDLPLSEIRENCHCVRGGRTVGKDIQTHTLAPRRCFDLVFSIWVKRGGQIRTGWYIARL